MMQVLSGLVPLATPVLRLLALGVVVMLATTCMTLPFRPALIGRGGQKTVRQVPARLHLAALHDVALTDAPEHTPVDDSNMEELDA